MNNFKASVVGLIIAFVCATVLLVWSMWSSATDDRETLHVYTWSDYIDPEIIQEFELSNNCKVCIDTFADNESMLAKLISGASGYDVIFPSSYVVPVMVRSGLLSKLDLSLLPNVKANLDTKFKNHFHENTMVYSVPYAFSVTGIAYRKDKVDFNQLDNSWNDLINTAFVGRVSMLRDVREMLGIGLRVKGFSVNSVSKNALSEALSYIIGLKRHVAKLDNEMYRTAIVSGELYACVGYNSDILQIMFDGGAGDNVAFYIPNEGSTCCWDEMVVTAKSSKKELSHKFIDYLYDGKIASRNMKYICSAVPNKEMWNHLSPEYKSNELINLSSNVLDKVELIRDIGDNISLYSDMWDKFMSSSND